MKRIIKIYVEAIVLVSMIFILSGCNISDDNSKKIDKETKINISTTLFPYYDFTRAVIGEVDSVSLTMVVGPGQESHSFEPTPKDIINIQNSDLFIYNGGSIENWVDIVLQSSEKSNKSIMRMMDFVDVMQEETVEGMDLRFEDEHEHSHNDEYEHSEEEHINIEGEHLHEEETEYDEHIWTSPVNAMLMVSYICDRICELDPENEDIYKENAEKYVEKIKSIDGQFREEIEKMKNKEIIFADKFPLLYFAKEYGLTYYAAFPGCGDDMEPSAKTIAFLINKVNQDKIDKVFYLELSSPMVANTICEDTQAKAAQFNTCHNVTEKQFESGVTYVDLMRENLQLFK